MRNVLYALLTLCVTLFVLVVGAEIIVRFLPWHTGFQSVEVNDDQPVFRFELDRTFRYSIGWDFKLAVERQTNNEGWLNDQDYTIEGVRPLVAVIGDSFVEAAQVPYEQSYYGRLAAELDGESRVYSFGAGSAPLSQYEAWARHASRTYAPEVFIFSIIGNDYDESLLAFSGGCRFGTMMPGMNYYVRGDDGDLTLRRTDLDKDPLRELAKRSALLGYLVRNVHVQEAPARIEALFSAADKPGEAQYAGQTCAGTNAARIEASREVVDAWLSRLPDATGVGPERIFLVFDALRPDIYDPQRLARARDSYPARMHAYTQLQALAEGFNVIDMEGPFIARHEATGEVFEYPFDGHWNPNGHAVVARALLGDPDFRDLVER